ncbi:unnamed protein product, partial [Didymodactylos carnosus]
KHFNDHIEAIKAQLHPLVDQINEMAEKIQNLKIEQLTNKAYEDLDQWRADIHKLVDDIYSIKRKEIEQIVETNEASFVKHKSEQMDEIEKIKLNVEQLISEDDATVDQIEVLKSALQTTETNLATVQKQFIVVNIRVLDSDLVRIKCDLNTNMINLNANQEQQQGRFNVAPYTFLSAVPQTTLTTLTTTPSNMSIYVRDIKSGRVRAVVGAIYMLTQDEELWEKDLPPHIEQLLQKDSLAGRYVRTKDTDANTTITASSLQTTKRDKFKLVTFCLPHNTGVQVYDYRAKRSRIVFGPELVMLGPDEHFTLINLSGSIQMFALHDELG